MHQILGHNPGPHQRHSVIYNCLTYSHVKLSPKSSEKLSFQTTIKCYENFILSYSNQYARSFEHHCNAIMPITGTTSYVSSLFWATSEITFRSMGVYCYPSSHFRFRLSSRRSERSLFISQGVHMTKVNLLLAQSNLMYSFT